MGWRGGWLSCLILSLMVNGCAPLGQNRPISMEETLVLTERTEPPNLDSATSTDLVSFTVMNNVMEGLMRLDAEQNPIPAMAQSFPQVSEDKKRYLFTLRDAKWSDGREVTAYDFEYGWKRALDPETKSQYAYILEPIRNAMAYNQGKVDDEEVGVRALDAKRLEVELVAPTPYFLHLLTFTTYMPQRQDMVEHFGDQFAMEAHTLVYNGPFVLREWNHNQNLLLQRNPYYWDQRNVHLKQVDIKLVKEASTSVNLYISDYVDYTLINENYVDGFRHSQEVRTIPDSTSWYLEMNQREGMFRHAKLRKALNLAIDRQALTQYVIRDGSQPAGGIVPPAVGTFREQVPDEVRYDPQQAKKLWKEGLQELGMDSLQSIELLGDDTPGSKNIMVFLKEQLYQNLDIPITITSVPFKQRLQRGRAGQFQLLLSAWGADYNDPMTFLDIFLTGQSYNRGRWSHAEFDRLVQQAKVNADEKERMQQLIQAERVLIQDAGVVPLYYRSQIGVAKSYVKGMVWHPIGPEYSLKWVRLQGKEGEKK